MTITSIAPETGEREALQQRLAEWIDAEGITGNYPTDGIAARLVASLHSSYLTRWLDQGGSAFLRGAVMNHKDHTDLTPAEAWDEDYRHGNLRADVRRWGV